MPCTDISFHKPQFTGRDWLIAAAIVAGLIFLARK